MTSGWMSIGQWNRAAIQLATPTPAPTPMSPPATDSESASTRNCVKMWCGSAPTAMRMPISRVRSVTLTSMMFMMPIPPTSSDTAATLASSIVIVCAPCSCAPAISLRFRT